MNRQEQFATEVTLLKTVLSDTQYRDAVAIANGKKELEMDELYDTLYSILMKNMPYGTAKARTGDPVVWIVENLNKYIEASELTETKIKKPVAYDFGFQAHKRGVMCAWSRDKLFISWYKANERQNVFDIEQGLPHMPSQAAKSGWVAGWNAAEADDKDI